MNRNRCKQLLIDGLMKMELKLEEKTVELLLDYLESFDKWNQAYNLSAIRQTEKMVSRHLLDSLTLVPFVKTAIDQHQGPFRLIDVGTGGGLPGLPIAIVFPEIQVTLLDSNGKKTRFLFQTSVKLGLDNVTVENERAEKFSPADKFAIVTSRAFASLRDMVSVSQQLIEPDQGEYWAMKGVYPDSELAECQGLAELKSAERLTVPRVLPDDSDEERYLLRLKPVN